MPACLICEKPVEPFLDFGRMPVANGFLRPEQFAGEAFWPLAVGYCAHCHMVQLTEHVDPSQLFHEHYAYFSSISTRMAEHFRQFAGFIRTEYMTAADPLVVELGSNDGIMLRHFAEAGIRHLGVEPSANVAAAARERGVKTLSAFFNEETAQQIRAEHGPADVVSGANVICHLPNIHSVLKGVTALIKDKGVFIFEEPYLGDILEKTSYDQIYDEHYFYFSVHALKSLFAMHGLEVIDCLPQETHGGSMRYVVARQGARTVSARVPRQMMREAELGLTRAESYGRFAQRVRQSRDELKTLLVDMYRQGKRVAGYGATSKSTTVLNFAGIGPELLEYISDTTPGKQGTYSPGMHVPVKPYETFKSHYPDYALLLAWNHGAEIIAKEAAFTAAGGRFISYVPTVKLI